MPHKAADGKAKKKRRKRGRKKRPLGPLPMKPRCIAALDVLYETSLAAREFGIEIRVSCPKGKRRETLHVMFNHALVRLFEWWPATGTAIARVGPFLGQKQYAADFSDALGMAATTKRWV